MDLARGRRDDEAHHGDPQAAPLSEDNYGPTPPWHDVQMRIEGPAVDDVSYTFRERWEDPTPLDRRTPVRALLHRAAKVPNEPSALPPERTAPALAGMGAPTRAATAKPTAATAAPAPAKAQKSRKLSWKEERELEGMEAAIETAESEVARLEALFAAPDFYEKHGSDWQALEGELKAKREEVQRLYSRWEELEALPK